VVSDELKEMAVVIRNWWFVESNPVMGFKGTQVADALERNFFRAREGLAPEWEPVALVPDFEAAQVLVSEYKRARKEQRMKERDGAE